MHVKYNLLYKWENLEDGTKEKFLGRLDALATELSLQTKLGCYDMMMPVYLPFNMYDDNMKKKDEQAKKNYHLRGEKLSELIELIKTRVRPDQKIDNGYLYELWISKIFELNWRENEQENDPLDDIKILYNELLLNSEVNPFDIDLSKKTHKEKRLSRIFKVFKRNN